jgi:hypothetical protein
MDDQPLPAKCPLCGKPLSFHASRPDRDGNGPSEWVSSYLCFTHGLFTRRHGKGLIEEL